MLLVWDKCSVYDKVQYVEGFGESVHRDALCAESIPQDSMICKKTSLKRVDTTIHQDIFLNGKDCINH